MFFVSSRIKIYPRLVHDIEFHINIKIGPSLVSALESSRRYFALTN